MPTISRTNDQGQTEGMALDNTTGTYTKTNLDGSTEVTRTFRTPGPLYGKVHKVEKTVNGQTSTVYQASYDELGRLVRTVDESGYVVSYRYDSAGNFEGQTLSLSSALRESLTKQEHELLTKVNQANYLSKDSAESELAYFYIDKMHDFQKSKNISYLIKNDVSRFLTELHTIYYNSSLSESQKKEQYRRLSEEFPTQKEAIEIYEH